MAEPCTTDDEQPGADSWRADWPWFEERKPCEQRPRASRCFLADHCPCCWCAQRRSLARQTSQASETPQPQALDLRLGLLHSLLSVCGHGFLLLTGWPILPLLALWEASFHVHELGRFLEPRPDLASLLHCVSHLVLLLLGLLLESWHELSVVLLYLELEALLFGTCPAVRLPSPPRSLRLLTRGAVPLMFVAPRLQVLVPRLVLQLVLVTQCAQQLAGM